MNKNGSDQLEGVRRLIRALVVVAFAMARFIWSSEVQGNFPTTF